MNNGEFSEARLGRMRDVMAGHVGRGVVPGVVTLVSRRGEVQVDAIGTKAFGGSEPMRRETIFRIASVTKPIVAAPTMGLPERIEGERNWDYRYAWIRDAAFTLYALISLGLNEEAGSFMGWVRDRCEAGDGGHLQPLYGIDGREEIPEVELDHLSGYKDSRPVRLGNAANNQLQLDLYGAVLDAAYLYNKHGAPLDYELWQNLQEVLDWLSNNWRQPDEGMWEVRGDKRHFVSSKLMCWVALERAVRVAH
jgi:GH15 family glucan-1,4-alpha-glucosidase